MPLRTLTREELQALTLYANGFNTDEVAQRQQVHQSVAQDWLRIAARKLGAANRIHAVAIATELGIIKIFRGPGRQQLIVHDLLKEPISAAADDDEDFIRERAYELWLADGKPEGRDKKHWEQAKALLNLTASPAVEDPQSPADETPAAPVNPDDLRR